MQVLSVRCADDSGAANAHEEAQELRALQLHEQKRSGHQEALQRRSQF